MSSTSVTVSEAVDSIRYDSDGESGERWRLHVDMDGVVLTTRLTGSAIDSVDCESEVIDTRTARGLTVGVVSSTSVTVSEDVDSI